MRWEQGRRSTNVEDRRAGGTRMGLLGGGGLMTLALVLFSGKVSSARQLR